VRQEVSSEWCAAHSEAMSPADAAPAPSGVHTAALLAIAPIALLAAVGVVIVYWRSVLHLLHLILFLLSSSAY
jgi:hypothetical protein